MPETILKNLGPKLTSELSRELQERDGISSDAARKRIQRAAKDGEISVLEKINFAHNQSFAYLPEHFGTKLYHERLFEAMTEARSVLRLPLAAMRARGGSLPTWLFPTFSGCPISAQFKQDSADIRLKLVELGFLVQEGELLHLSTVKPTARLKPAQLEAYVNVEQSFLVTFAEWLKRQRFVGNKISLRSTNDAPQFGYHQWDLVAPSYITPIATRTEKKANPGFVVADVILGRSVTEYEVQYFIEKCSNIRGQKSNRPFLAFLIADWFEQDALNLAQSKGVIFTTPKSLFGRRFAEALEEYRKVLTAKEEELEVQAAKISELLKKVQKVDLLDGLNGNLRGKLFEIIVGHCFLKEYGGTVLHGQLFTDPSEPDKKFDCDVLQLTPGTYLRACECKAYAGLTKVSLDEVTKWFKTIRPLISNHYGLDEYPHQEFHFWTSGDFDDDALAFLNGFQSSTKKVRIFFKRGTDLQPLIERVGDRTIKQVY